MSRFQVFVRVLVCHAVVLGLIVLLPLLKSCEWFPRKEQIITVDLASLPPLPPPDEETPEEVEEDPEEEVISEATPEPVPTPTATPQPEPTPTPEAAATPSPTATPAPTATPKPTPTPKSTLLTPEQIRERIQNQQNPSPPVAVPTLSPAQIQALISQGLPAGGGSGTAVGPVHGGSGVNLGGVSTELRNRLYSAWQQPLHLSGQAGIRAIASVKVQRSGQISSARILRGSGNQEFDGSVEKALSAVKFAKALPDGYAGDSCTFEIEFNLSQ